MNDKQIIIDGVDVSECEHLFRDVDCLAHIDFSECCEGYNPRYGYCPNIDCYYKQLKRKEQECEQLRNKLNSSIGKMNAQNEKLHNEIQVIRQQMKTILMVSNNGKYKPVKNSTKEQCYQVLGNIQELLGTNIIRLSEVNNGTNS